MKKSALFALMVFSSLGHAYEAQVKKAAIKADLASMIEKARIDTGASFATQDFILIEDRKLATSRYQMFVQTIEGVPVDRTAVRIWSDLKSDDLILGEMHLDEKTKAQQSLLKAKFNQAKFSAGALKSKQLSIAMSKFVANLVTSHPTDNKILSMKSQDVWANGDLVRKIEVRGRRGVHHFRISLLKNSLIEKTYIEFPQSEVVHTTLLANVFPIYEEVEGTNERLSYELRELKYVDWERKSAGESPLGSLGETKFLEAKYNPLLAETKNGADLGLWSEASIRRLAKKQIDVLPAESNDFSNGLLIQGRYATINLHPAIKEAFKDINFSLLPNVNHILSWASTPEGAVAVPVSGFKGKAINSPKELLSVVPFRLPDHNPTTYINSGFDEIQVYYGVTTLMDALVEMGFTDPELSTTPFHAFLYDPDISMKDNAYYYDNTINFTTYTPENPNLARDNPTVWHELGHGVMDRLMGPFLGFADSKGGYGGLSEGMADFVAKLVIEHQTNGQSFPGMNGFRIINQTGFYLTNEFHDEGEAYGGAMNDMLMSILKERGRNSLHGFTDLTLETMRLTRNHPALSARSWFEHMLIADELGSNVRAPFEFTQVILDALKARNFAFDGSFKPARLDVKFADTDLTNDSPASREKPLTPCGKDGFVDYELAVTLQGGDAEFIKFPATVKVEYKKGALQGAIKWEGEEHNPTEYTVGAAGEVLRIPLKASMECESINQPDGSCKDYAYLQVYNAGDSKPRAKKRFYLKLNKAQCL